MNGKPVQIQPSQVNQLAQAYKNELESAKAAGSDTAKAQAHFAKAESIKQILLNYQAQQNAKMAAQTQGQALSQPNQTSQNNMGTPNTNSPMIPSPGTRQNSTPSNQKQSPLPNSSGSGTSSSLGNPALPANAITEENFNQVKARLSGFEKGIQQLTNSKKSYTLTPEQINKIESQLTELKLKYTRYQKFASYMKDQLLAQAKSKNQALPQNQSANNGQPGLTMSGATTMSGPTTTTTANAPTPAPSAAGVAATNASMALAQDQSNTQTQQPSTTDKSPSKSSSHVNLSGITKSSVPSLPITTSINVKPPNPIPMRPNGNNIRPTLLGGVANGLGQSLGTPALYKLPNYDFTNTGNTLPDNGGRVLNKRKLSELVNTIGSDEGDGKTTIDGDVEELLLDLADEFITSVTSFACRLAKHRKVETIDVKDVQLHLERNWNIKIPGYSIDEIKSVRRLQPSSSYQQKVSGVEIAKSVNDIN